MPCFRSNWMLKTLRSNSAGFTLIELLIVISVIAALSVVLVSIVDPVGSQGKARDGVRLSHVKNLAEAIESYRQIEGSYPLDADPQNPASTLRTTYIRTWPSPLANDGTEDPAWAYIYAQAGTGFVLYSPNSRGGCYKYQTDWRNAMNCPIAECSTDISLASDCSEL